MSLPDGRDAGVKKKRRRTLPAGQRSEAALLAQIEDLRAQLTEARAQARAQLTEARAQAARTLPATVISNTVQQMQRAKINAFLEAFKLTCNVTASARQAGINRGTHYEWMQSVDGYVAEFVSALEEAVERLEAEARHRAMVGIEEPIFSAGKQMFKRDPRNDALILDAQGNPQPWMRRTPSDKLLLKLLSAWRPDLYERHRMLAPGHAFAHLYRTPQGPSLRDSALDAEGAPAERSAETATPVKARVLVIQMGRGERLRTLDPGEGGTNGHVAHE